MRHVILFLTALLLISRTAAAQTGAYIAAGGFADIKRFDSVEYGGGIYGGDDSSLDATGAGGGIRVGTYLASRWSLELGVDVGTKTSSTEDSFPVILAIFPPPRLQFERSSSFVAVSSLVGFHPPKRGRLQLGYRGGFSFVRGTFTTNYPQILPAAEILATRLSTIPEITFQDLTPLIAPTDVVVKDTSGAIALGFEAAIDLSRRAAIVPEVRTLLFSSSGRTVVLIRPGASVRWSF